MNDMLILDKNDYMIKSTKKISINKFDIKDLDIADVMLKIKIFRTFDINLFCPSFIILRRFSIMF